MLTAYNDNPIYYDEIGNPTLYYNNAAMTWVNGRRLSEIYFDDFGDMLFFDYDSDGMRLCKYGPRVYDYNYAFANTPLFYVDYYYDGDTLIYERRSYNGDNQSTLFTIEYLYGVNGITGFRIHQGNTTTDYFYVKNIMGDVLGIVDSSGTLVAEYRYDAYGNPVMILDGNGNDVSNNYAHIANINPIRYRGYYYDIESGFYYLNSRYYDPEIGRFINADGYVSTGQDVNGFNMFAYCGNNPVMRKDPSGQVWLTSLILGFVAVVCTMALFGCSAQPTSDVGAAKPYVDMPGSDDPTSPNCYAYAISSPVNEQPGGTSGRIPTKWSDVNDVGKSVEADLKAKGYTVREISGPDAKVYDNEFKIALRVGTQPYAYNQYTGQLYYDYHFMRQTNTGQWAEKHGYGGPSVLWDVGMTPDTIPWTLGGDPYYDSAIIYYAVGN